MDKQQSNRQDAPKADLSDQPLNIEGSDNREETPNQAPTEMDKMALLVECLKKALESEDF